MNKELARYIPMMKMLAATFGKGCEIVLHDLAQPQSSVVYTINNHVTGRQIGQPFDHLIKQVLLSKDFTEDYKANYLVITPDNKEIKSSTVFLRNSLNKIIGAICINYDLSSLRNIQSFCNELLTVDTETIPHETEPFEHVVEIVDDLIDQIISNTDITSLKRKEKIELINFMEKKGVFLIKGSIDKVAEKMNISKVTVYSYLDEIKKMDNP